jgi:hypothetical protein
MRKVDPERNRSGLSVRLTTGANIKGSRITSDHTSFIASDAFSDVDIRVVQDNNGSL